MPASSITSKGQITIPKAIRDLLRLNPGDRISFQVQDDGKVLFEPETIDIRSLYGVLDPEKKGVSIEDMNEIIRNRGTGL